MLSTDFLDELFYSCFKYKNTMAAVANNMKMEFMPTPDYKAILMVMVNHYKEHGEAPTFGMASQMLSGNEEAKYLINDIRDEIDYTINQDLLFKRMEEFILEVKAIDMYEKVGKLFSSSKKSQGIDEIRKFSEWSNSFSLSSEKFTKVISTLGARHAQNKKNQDDIKNNSIKSKPVTSMYIDFLDNVNQGRDLRGQLICFEASSGVGKSHCSKHVGKSMALDGYNVLHIQLEGSEQECLDAYSGAIMSRNSFTFTKGGFSNEEFEIIMEGLKDVEGEIDVRSYEKFSDNVTTSVVDQSIYDYYKANDCYPDTLIIDSMDLLSSTNYRGSEERLKRLQVCQDLKNIATEYNIAIILTTQSRIMPDDWRNDPDNYLTEDHLAEGKGTARPLTWLISLNRTKDEEEVNHMRLFIAKARFGKISNRACKIVTDYDNEVFYDRNKSLILEARGDQPALDPQNKPSPKIVNNEAKVSESKPKPVETVPSVPYGGDNNNFELANGSMI